MHIFFNFNMEVIALIKIKHKKMSLFQTNISISNFFCRFSGKTVQICSKLGLSVGYQKVNSRLKKSDAN